IYCFASAMPRGRHRRGHSAGQPLLQVEPAVTATAQISPSVSTSTCRLRPATFFPASLPRTPPRWVVLTALLSSTPARGVGGRAPAGWVPRPALRGAHAQLGGPRRAGRPDARAGRAAPAARGVPRPLVKGDQKVSLSFTSVPQAENGLVEYVYP